MTLYYNILIVFAHYLIHTVCNKYFIYLYVNLGITFSIIDIIVAYNWVPCHIQYVNLYLFAFGSLTFLLILFASMYTIENLKNKSFILGKLLTNPFVASFIFLNILVVIWGSLILTNTEQGDCNSICYKYVYYRTMFIIFLGPIMGPIISILLMSIMSELFNYYLF